jgi:transcription factor TFIIIB component B''
MRRLTGGPEGGKSFAPKAVRRRPGAAAASTSKPREPTASTASQPSQAQTPDETNTTPAAEPQTEAQLPTPVATQHVASELVQHTGHTTPGPATTVPESSAPVVESRTIAPSPAIDAVAPQHEQVTEAVSTPVLTKTIEIASPVGDPESRRRSEQPSLQAPKAPHVTRDEPDTSLSEPVPAVQEASATEPMPIRPISTPPSIPEHPSNDAARPAVTEPTYTTEAPLQTTEVVQVVGAAEIQALEEQTPAVEAPSAISQKRRRLPWIAVNAPLGDEDATLAATTSQPKPRRRRKPITLREIDEQEGEVAEQEEQPARPNRTSGRARAKRKAPETAEGDEPENAAPPAKKARKPRKDKGKRRATAEGEESGNEEVLEGNETRPRKTRKKKQNPAQVEGANEGEEGGQGEQQPKRRGRPPREPTPSDAEDEVIDPGATLMNSIASRNIRVGKLSEREKQMRMINWEEVKQARREKERNQTAREIQTEMDRLRKEQEAAEADAVTARTLPQYHLVDNIMVLKPGSGMIDHEAEAQRAHDEMVVVAEDDLTKQINARSFLRNNKRFPNEFLLPGQGKHWSFRDTEDFYKAMSIFGTDFAMMERLFPGVGRKSIKKKFNREERQNPQRVKEVLQGRRNCNWEEFLEQTGRDDADFADVDAIKAQLDAEAKEMQIVIDQAKEEAEERRRQRRIAGVESEDEAAGGENERGKKGKGKKVAKKVGFELAPDEEVVGNVEDDDNWGVE